MKLLLQFVLSGLGVVLRAFCTAYFVLLRGSVGLGVFGGVCPDSANLHSLPTKSIQDKGIGVLFASRNSQQKNLTIPSEVLFILKPILSVTTNGYSTRVPFRWS